MMDKSKMATGSIFDSDIQTSFDNADITACLMRIERQLMLIGLTIAFGVGVLMYLASKQ